MNPYARTMLVVSLCAAPLALAQTATDPSGHWEGSIQAPAKTIEIEFDLARGDKGEYTGTFGQPAQGLKGLPVRSIAVDGDTVRLVVNGDSGASSYEGTLSADRKSLAGNLSWSGYTIPFKLTKTGDARFMPAFKSGPIAAALEGEWSGAIESDGKSIRLIVKMANQPDGTSKGTVTRVGSGMEIPIAITQKASSLTIEVPSVGATYAATLNPQGTELAGEWTQTGIAAPLMLRHPAK